MRVIVPFDAQSPKTRLSPVLDETEREAFARAMLQDVLATVEAAGHEATVLATVPVDCDAPVSVDDRALTPAVNAALEDADGPVAVVMADLPLATPAAIDRLTAPAADVVLAPGLGGGTNALVVRTGEFAVDFHGASIQDHRAAADAAGASVTTVDSFRLAVDVDEPRDLTEVLLHGTGAAPDWLRDVGLAVAATDGRIEARRTGESAGQRG